MRRTLVILLMCLALPTMAFADASALAPGGASPAGRFQLFVVPGHVGNPFLVDTVSGCVWHLFHDEKAKRSTFIEVDVENLHWSWGSGAQQVLVSRVDAANLTDEQKRVLKQELQKTGCGLSSVVLTPGTAEASQPAKPKK